MFTLRVLRLRGPSVGREKSLPEGRPSPVPSPPVPLSVTAPHTAAAAPTTAAVLARQRPECTVLQNDGWLLSDSFFCVSGHPSMGGPMQRMTPPRGMVPLGPQVWHYMIPGGI